MILWRQTGIQEQLFTVITAGVGMPNGESTCTESGIGRQSSIHVWVLVWNAMNKTFYRQTHVLLDKQVSEEDEVI